MASKRMISQMEPLQLSKVKNREVSPLARGKSPAMRVVQVTPLQQHQIGTYLLEKCLGAGAYGEVYKASHLKTKDQVAVKKMEKAPEIYPEVVRETDIIYTIGTHPYCVKFLDKIETENHVFLVMSFASGGDLYEFVFPEVPEKASGESLPRSLNEEKSLKLFCKILVGLEHVHKKNIVHGDIKLENIFLQKNGEPQIGDFGLARYFEPGTKTYYAQGTLHYCAPESILQKDIEGPEVDIWSMGIMLYIMLFGRYPFYGATEVDVLRAIAYGPLRLNFKGAGSETCDLLRCILTKEPEKRASIAAIKAHPAVRSIFTEIEAEMYNNPSMVVREASVLFGDAITTARREMTPTRGLGTAAGGRGKQKLGLLVDKDGRALDNRGRALDDGRGRKRKSKSPRTKSKSRSRSRSRGRSKSITRGRSKSVTKPSSKKPLSASQDISSVSIAFSSTRTTSFDQDIKEKSPRKSLSKSPRSRREVKKVKRVATDDSMHRSALKQASGFVGFETSGERLQFFHDDSPVSDSSKTNAVLIAAQKVREIEEQQTPKDDSDSEEAAETPAEAEAAGSGEEKTGSPKSGSPKSGSPKTGSPATSPSAVQRMKSPEIVPKLNMGALSGLVAEATSAHSSRSMTVRGFISLDSPFLPTPKSRKIDIETLIKGIELVRAPVASLAPPKDMDRVPLKLTAPSKPSSFLNAGSQEAVAVTPPITPREEEATVQPEA